LEAATTLVQEIRMIAADRPPPFRLKSSEPRLALVPRYGLRLGIWFFAAVLLVIAVVVTMVPFILL
jgi:hypothetical protein